MITFKPRCRIFSPTGKNYQEKNHNVVHLFHFLTQFLKAQMNSFECRGAGNWSPLCLLV